MVRSRGREKSRGSDKIARKRKSRGREKEKSRGREKGIRAAGEEGCDVKNDPTSGSK